MNTSPVSTTSIVLSADFSTVNFDRVGKLIIWNSKGELIQATQWSPSAMTATINYTLDGVEISISPTKA